MFVVLFCNPDISIASRVQTVLALAEPSKSFRMQHLGKRICIYPAAGTLEPSSKHP